MATDQTGDVRARHAQAVERLREAEAKVRGLNRSLATEIYELVDQKRTLKRLRPDGTEAPAAERGVWAIIATEEVVGSRLVAHDVPATTRWRARLDLPDAIRALREAEIDEAELRPQVAELDRQEAQREKLRLLPAVKRAYDRLDRALTAAAKERQAVADALQALADVAPTDVTVMAGLCWRELDLIEHRRMQVKTWTSQNGHTGA